MQWQSKPVALLLGIVQERIEKNGVYYNAEMIRGIHRRANRWDKSDQESLRRRELASRARQNRCAVIGIAFSAHVADGIHHKYSNTVIRSITNKLLSCALIHTRSNSTNTMNNDSIFLWHDCCGCLLHPHEPRKYVAAFCESVVSEVFPNPRFFACKKPVIAKKRQFGAPRRHVKIYHFFVWVFDLPYPNALQKTSDFVLF